MDKNTYSLEVSQETFSKIKNFYQDDMVKNDNENLDFFARNNNCSISGYKSLKVVFQGSKAQLEAGIWDPEVLKEKVADPEEDVFFTGSHAGSDEVGTGDFFGPIIVVAAYVRGDQFQELLDLGVKDSKKLSDEKICEIGAKLIHMIPYSSLHLDNIKYNLLTSKGFNMNKLKAYLHNKALINLRKKVDHPIEYFVMDQFAPERLYYSYLRDEILVQRNIKFITKGEDHSLAVACASIIARYSFLIKMDRLSKNVGVSLPKGAGPEVDEVAEELYHKLGHIAFNNICKNNFKNYEKLQ
ncbi:MAG: ribonuclease HIII [Bacilli bacterium]|nr:ribonuclease HIII [Bacilli bacterium]MDD3422514.1 ribonuclease HIII [Bacilli bacterium]MDD4066186.1 ribonuclease HIII [Bacilli bacterium]